MPESSVVDPTEFIDPMQDTCHGKERLGILAPGACVLNTEAFSTDGHGPNEADGGREPGQGKQMELDSHPVVKYKGDWEELDH